MEPNRIGRVFGIGARVAGAKLREQAERIASAPPPQNPPRPANTAGVTDPPRPKASSAAASSPRPAAPPRPAAANVAGSSRRLARGAGRFTSTLVRPFARATSILWHQIAGIFFALFAAFFFEHTWMLYKAHHLADRHIFVYAAFGLAFAWFAVSSFWRARRRQRQG